MYPHPRTAKANCSSVFEEQVQERVSKVESPEWFIKENCRDKSCYIAKEEAGPLAYCNRRR